MAKRTKNAGPPRKPHNARGSEYISFDELLVKAGNETRPVQVGDQQVTMTRTERLLRLMVDRALQGKVRDVMKLLDMMSKNPRLAATYREQTTYKVHPVLFNA